jgi:hypothetical protein
MTWGEGKRAFLGGIFQRDWGTLHDKDIEGIYKTLLRSVEEKPFGIFDVVAMFLGEEEAWEVSEHSNIVSRPRPTLRRQRQARNSDSDDQMDVLEILEVTSSRRR